MKTADEILALILDRVANAYARPGMFAPGAEAVDGLLWHLHVLWLEGMGLGLDGFHEAIARDRDGEPCGANSFSGHYRERRAGGAEAEDAEVTRYVVDCWRKVDAELGIALPPAFGLPRPELPTEERVP